MVVFSDNLRRIAPTSIKVLDPGKLMVLLNVDLDCRVAVPLCCVAEVTITSKQYRELIQMKNNLFPPLNFGKIHSQPGLLFGLANTCAAIETKSLDFS